MLRFGIDVGTSSLKFAQLSYGGEQSSILQMFTYQLPNIPERFTSDIALGLKAFLAEKKIKIRNAIVGISGKEVNIRFVRVMTNNSDRISHIIQMELTQFSERMEVALVHSYIPLHFDSNMGKNQEPGGIILLMIAHDPWLTKLQNFFYTAGIDVKGYLPNSFALYQSYSKLGKIRPNEFIYLVQMEDENSDFAITHQSDLYFLRNLNTGLISRDEPEENELDLENVATTPASFVNPTMATQMLSVQKYDVQKVCDIVEASLKFARLQTNIKERKIDRILLTGTNSCQNNLISSVSKHLKSPVERFEFSESIVLNTSSCSTEIQDLWQKQPEKFANVLGLACTTDEVPLLITQKQRAKREFFHRQIWEYIAILFILVSSMIVLVQNHNDLERYIEIAKHTKERYESLEMRAQKIQELEQENHQLQNKVSFLQSQVIMNRQLLDSLKWFQEHIPEQIYLNQITFALIGQKNVLTVQGTVEESNVDVYTMLKQFKHSLEDVFQIIQEKDPRLQEEGRLEFEIKLEMK